MTEEARTTLTVGKAAPNAPVFQYHGTSDEIVPFKVQPDLGNEWSLGQDDQRHRAVAFEDDGLRARAGIGRWRRGQR